MSRRTSRRRYPPRPSRLNPAAVTRMGWGGGLHDVKPRRANVFVDEDSVREGHGDVEGGDGRVGLVARDVGVDDLVDEA